MTARELIVVLALAVSISQCWGVDPFTCPVLSPFDRPTSDQRSARTLEIRHPRIMRTVAVVDTHSESPQINVPSVAASGPCDLQGIKKKFNFAAYSAGAQVLASSPGLKGADKTLLTDADKYMSSACSLQSKWFVVQLSEDIEVEAVCLTNLEHYSSGVEHFQVLGSDKFPTPEWILLGYFRADNTMSEQTFCIHRQVVVRYLKVRLLSHYGSEQYCTLNSLKVYGSRLLETLGRALDQTLKEAKQAMDELAAEDLNFDPRESTNAAKEPSSIVSKRETNANPFSSDIAHQNGSQPTHTHSNPSNPDVKSDSSAQQGKRRDEITVDPSPHFSTEAASANAASPSVQLVRENTALQENIITKLTNRIKDLEINQTLSTRAIERLSQSLSNTVEKLETAVLSMDAGLLARHKSVQVLLTSAVDATNASTITILLLRQQLSALNIAYDNAEMTLRMLRFALAVAVVVICTGVAAALFRTGSAVHVQMPLQSRSASSLHRRRRRQRSSRVLSMQSLDIVDEPDSNVDVERNVPDRPTPFNHIRSISDDTFNYATPRVLRQQSSPFLSSNKFDALLGQHDNY
uniref:SUN domain-containing protein n=1 Tax=Spongospora subterranea TaxID=70186 RepID=A0A0H5R9C6_9EUKA|eukprot:CRZ10376.1 hypothetical protein [Spongospora subterranea]